MPDSRRPEGDSPAGGDLTVLTPLQPIDKDGPHPVIPGGKGGRTEWVDWRGQRIPLAEAVLDCSFGQSADGKTLAILAGGLRESLDLYLVDHQGGVLMRLPTYGGHCLPRSFNDGAGSLPALDGQDLVLFAFEREGRIHFRAVDPAGGVHASAKDLSLEVTGFQATSNSRTSKVEVRFAGAAQALRFDHPSAPVFEVVPVVVTFPATPVGERVLGSVQVRNKGRRPVEVTPFGEAGEFRIESTGRVMIGPGERATLAVSFTPRVPGSRTGQITLHGPRELVIRARGKGLDLPVVGLAGGAVGAEPHAPRVAWRSLTPARPVSGPPRSEEPAPLALSSGKPARSARAELEARDGFLVVRGAPFQTFVLAALEAGRQEGDARPMLGGLRGQLDADGVCRMPISVLGIVTERIGLVAFVATPMGKRVRTRAVEIGPEPR